MTHYIELQGNKITVDINCTHPDMTGNTTTSVGCNGNCHECLYAIAKMKSHDFFTLLDMAKK